MVLETKEARLRILVKKIDKTTAEIATDLGYARAQTVTDNLREGRIADKFIKSFCNQYGFNSEWVLTGKGDISNQRHLYTSRIRRFTQTIGISESDFYSSIGVEPNYFDVKHENENEILDIINEKYPVFDTTWLIYGWGEMLRTSRIEVGERLRVLRKHLGYSAEAFSKVLGYKSFVTYRGVESGYKSLPQSAKIELENRWNVDPLWLELGVGEMFKPSYESSIKEDRDLVVKNSTSIKLRSGVYNKYTSLLDDNFCVYAPFISRKKVLDYIERFDNIDFINALPQYAFTIPFPYPLNPYAVAPSYLVFEVIGNDMNDGSHHSISDGDIAICSLLHNHESAANWEYFENSKSLGALLIVHKEGIVIRNLNFAKENFFEFSVLNTNKTLYPNLTLKSTDIKQILVVEYIVKQMGAN